MVYEFSKRSKLDWIFGRRFKLLASFFVPNRYKKKLLLRERIYYYIPTRFSWKKLFNLIKTEINIKRNKRKLNSYPYWALIDPCNICNLNCVLCPSGSRKELFRTERCMMSVEDFKKIIDEIGEYLFHIVLYNWGEPFLNKKLAEMIKIANDRNIGTELSTNFQILDETLAEDLVKNGLDRIMISCDGTSQETYEKYRKGGSYDKIIKNIKILAEAKKKFKSVTPIIDVQFIVFRHNEHEIPETKKFYEYGADLVSITRNCLLIPSVIKESMELLPKKEGYDSWEKQFKINEDGTVSRIPFTFCPLFYRQIAINPNGDIYPCCGPSHIDGYKFGNFFKNSFMEIWNNQKYQDARALNSGIKCDNACGICFTDKWFEEGELQK